MLLLRTTRLLNSAFKSTATTALARGHLPLQLKLANPQFYQIRKMATAIPTTQKGVIIHKTGGVEVLEYKTDLPVPVPAEGEILVKNDFIGINYIDTCVLQPPSPLLPTTNTMSATSALVSILPPSP